MNIDRIIDSVVSSEPKTKPNSKNGSDQTKISTLKDLLLSDLSNEDIQIEIYSRFKSDIELYIENFMTRCKDSHASDGLFKCSLETWQAVGREIGIYYFNKNKYLRDTKRTAVGGGTAYNDELLKIGITLYEDLCNEYRKQFFIYDCCRFLGMSLETMYRLSDLHSEMLKKVHSMQESSMRTALASGRSNVTAMAILLNHDYNYTKTTEVIHHSTDKLISADRLPELTDNSSKPNKLTDILTDDLM